MRVLVIEDNRRLADLVCSELRERGFTPDTAYGLRQAEELLGVVDYDALVLDLGLPDGEGLEWLRHRRESGELPPLLVLTARANLGDRVAGLDAGADDYLVKPFEIDELAARLRAMLRRPGRRALPIIQAGALRFDVASRNAVLGTTPLELSRRETDLLAVLIRNAGNVVRRAVIEEAIYTLDEPVTPNAVEATASRLRRKLEGAGGGGLLIAVRGVGYLLREAS
ncbi:response regulator transcription factor [Sphingosinicella sp. CPCC 101087]|uniref:response regulator transcription factor n=1 Tax=Sphingosinicella sp. CPCC 101087 TaxID=2497754 RepID=UPI00101DB81C|nr:response regulator transcription factor [Sphingosinicella sp. CPCC 101087]